jgi:hypothetical protein
VQKHLANAPPGAFLRCFCKEVLLSPSLPGVNRWSEFMCLWSVCSDCVTVVSVHVPSGGIGRGCGCDGAVCMWCMGITRQRVGGLNVCVYLLCGVQEVLLR